MFEEIMSSGLPLPHRCFCGSAVFSGLRRFLLLLAASWFSAGSSLCFTASAVFRQCAGCWRGVLLLFFVAVVLGAGLWD